MNDMLLPFFDAFQKVFKKKKTTKKQRLRLVILRRILILAFAPSLLSVLGDGALHFEVKDMSDTQSMIMATTIFNFIWKMVKCAQGCHQVLALLTDSESIARMVLFVNSSWYNLTNDVLMAF